MPKKFVDTSPRRWGTRFDSLVPASPNIPQTELSSPSTATPQLARPVPSGHRDLPKLPHNASVFVGSLPSAMDHRELIRALDDHLSPYTEIHNIKVVRDLHHGGVCAFVQCKVCVSDSQFVVLSDHTDSLRRALLSLSLPSTLSLPRHSLVVPFATKRLGPSEPFSYHTGLSVLHPASVLFTSHSAPTVFTPPDPSSGDVTGTGSLKPIDPATTMRLYKTQGAR